MSGNRRIDQLQNNARSITLFRAIAVAHRHTQSAQATSLVMSLVLAVLGIIARIAHPSASAAVTIAGAVWAGTYAAVLAPLVGRHLRTSATLQEMLDVDLFGLPWNLTLVGVRLPEDEVSRLSRRFRRDEGKLRDYYLVASVAGPYDVFFCLEQNLAWGSRVRRRYAQVLVGVVVVWCLAVVVVNFATGSTVATVVTSWLVPSLGLLLTCWDIARAQISSTRERERVLPMVRSFLEGGPAPATAGQETFARQIQDVLFLVRRQQPRTPQWFFGLFHNDDLADFRYKMAVLEERHGTAQQSGP